MRTNEWFMEESAAGNALCLKSYNFIVNNYNYCNRVSRVLINPSRVLTFRSEYKKPLKTPVFASLHSATNFALLVAKLKALPLKYQMVEYPAQDQNFHWYFEVNSCRTWQFDETIPPRPTSATAHLRRLLKIQQQT